VFGFGSTICLGAAQRNGAALRLSTYDAFPFGSQSLADQCSVVVAYYAD